MRYVVGIILSEDHKYVLLLKKIKPVEIAGMWNGLGGKLEKFESPEYAVSREVKEESGLIIDPDEWKPLASLGGGRFIIEFFYATHPDLTKAVQLEDEELMIAHVDALPKDTITNLNWMIPFIEDHRISKPIVISPM